MSVFYDEKGQRLQLRDSGKKGGEAKIYNIDNHPELCAKIWHQSDPAHGDKIRQLLSHPPVSHTGWPLGLITDHNPSNVVGFTMAKLAGEPWYCFNNPSSRRAMGIHYPLTPEWIGEISRQLVDRVSEIHHTGDYVIGDINDANILIAPDGRVSVIDIDSMQIGAELCTVARPEYLAPECHGYDLKVLKRTVHQDNFAIAVLLYQLWFNGVHPFQGSGSPFQLNERIAQGKCACLGKALPPVFAPAFDALPKKLQKLFIDAFSGTVRPSATDWHNAITTEKTALNEFINLALFRRTTARRFSPVNPFSAYIPGTIKSLSYKLTQKLNGFYQARRMSTLKVIYSSKGNVSRSIKKGIAGITELLKKLIGGWYMIAASLVIVLLIDLLANNSFSPVLTNNAEVIYATKPPQMRQEKLHVTADNSSADRFNQIFAEHQVPGVSVLQAGTTGLNEQTSTERLLAILDTH